MLTGGGYYMYIEGSTPQAPGDKADLISPVLPAGQGFCLSLATNMFGDAMGSIAILAKVTFAEQNLNLFI